MKGLEMVTEQLRQVVEGDGRKGEGSEGDGSKGDGREGEVSEGYGREGNRSARLTGGKSDMLMGEREMDNMLSSDRDPIQGLL